MSLIVVWEKDLRQPCRDELLHAVWLKLCDGCDVIDAAELKLNSACLATAKIKEMSSKACLVRDEIDLH